MAKKKEKKRDIEILQRIKEFFLRDGNNYRWISSLEISKAINSKKETIERYMEIFILFNSAEKQGDQYRYLHPATSPFPRDAITKLMNDVGEIYRESASASRIPDNEKLKTPKIQHL